MAGGEDVQRLNLSYILHLFTCREEIVKRATNIARDNLISLGTCIGKFTKSKSFRLHITALDLLGPYAKVSISQHVGDM